MVAGHTGVMEYRTVARDATADIEVRRSRFRCTLRRVEDEAAARAVISGARSEYFDARHHCSAFVLGPDGAVQRSSDDGEPSGTAGAPMLAVLTGAGLSDVVAVVTRWFGGVLLGAGGLVRAYSDAVRAALAEAGTLTRRRLTEVAVDLPHADAGRVEAALRDAGTIVMDTHYGAAATLTLATDDVDALEHRLASLTAGEASPQVIGTSWVDLG